MGGRRKASRPRVAAALQQLPPAHLRQSVGDVPKGLLGARGLVEAADAGDVGSVWGGRWKASRPRVAAACQLHLPAHIHQSVCEVPSHHLGARGLVDAADAGDVGSAVQRAFAESQILQVLLQQRLAQPPPILLHY